MSSFNSGHQIRPRHTASSFDLRGSYRSSGPGLICQEYNDPSAILNSTFDHLPSYLPSLQPLSNPSRRLRKHSLSASLRAGLGEDGSYPTSTNFNGSFSYGSGIPSHSDRSYSPLPPLSSVLSLLPLESFPNLPPFGSYSGLPPLSDTTFSPLPSTHQRQSDHLRGHGYQNSLGSYTSSFIHGSMLEDRPEWDGTQVGTSLAVDNKIAMSPGPSPTPGRRRRRRGSTMDLTSGQSSNFELQASPIPKSSTSLLPSPAQTQFHTSLESNQHTSGMLPMPPLRTPNSRVGSGHIVLSSDYRLLRLSQNVLLWLEYSSGSLTGTTRGMAALAGQPVASLVAASDQLVFGDYLAVLHAERRKAEKMRMKSLSGSVEGLARGICKWN